MHYLKEIDGLRALAVMPVVFYHAGFSYFSGGFVGVDVFFVISGYLITSIITKELDTDTFSLVSFYERRARRILPPLVVVIACCLPFAWLWLMPADLEELGQSIIAVSLFASNIFFLRREADYFQTANEIKPLLHTWSLAVEEQFYLLFPLFLMVAWRLGKKSVSILLGVVTLASLFLAEWSIISYPAATFYLLPTRAWELGIGAFLAIHLPSIQAGIHGQKRTEWGSLLGLLLIIFSILVFDKGTPCPSFYTLLPTLGTGLIILYASASNLTGRLLGNKLLVGIGLISYSAYLWHQPLLALARPRSLVDPSPLTLALLCLASFPLAYFSWRFVEQPFRNKNRFSRQQVFSFAAGCSVILLGSGLLAHQHQGFPSRLKASVPDELLQVLLEQDYPHLSCWERTQEDLSPDESCYIGKQNSNPSFAIIGDSHGSSLVRALSKASADHGITGLDLTFTGCPVLLEVERLGEWDFNSTCRRFQQDLRQKIQEHSLPKTLVISLRWSGWLPTQSIQSPTDFTASGSLFQVGYKNPDNMEYFAFMKRSLTSTIHFVLRLGYQVVLVYPIPEAGRSVPQFLTKIHRSKGTLQVSDGATDLEVFKQRNALAYNILNHLGEHTALYRVYPEHRLCNTLLSGQCLTHLEGNPLYFDGDHLSTYGASLIVADILPHLAEPINNKKAFTGPSIQSALLEHSGTLTQMSKDLSVSDF